MFVRMPIAKLALVALDCPDPIALAAFYIQLVGGEVKQETATDDWIRVRLGSGCDLGFQRDPTYEPPAWPAGPSQQVHLDFDVEDLDVAERAALECGAVKAPIQPSPARWRVLLDPAGHPFCLVKR
jgi:Glyoxalase-like domain